EAFARLPAADRRSVARGSEDRVTAGPTVGGRERETQSKDTMRVCGGGRAPLANANVAGDCGRAQRLEPRFARRHAVQHLVAQVPLFGPAAFPAEVESQKSGVRMRSIRSLPCAPAFVPSAFCSPPGSASTGQNPVTATSYNVFSEVTGMTFGSGDSDALAYDSGTGRMTQYKFTVNGSSVTGNLTWNQNGTLQQLAITDPFDSANQQTCTYAYDDLARIGNVNCLNPQSQPIWTQAFTPPDPFGNVQKTGSNGGTSWLPTYTTPPTNQYSSIPGVTGPYYDSNGNVIKDGFHSYTWDAEGLPHSVDNL